MASEVLFRNHSVLLDVTDAPSGWVWFLVVGDCSWGSGPNIVEATKLWRSQAPYNARARKTTVYLAIDVRWFASPQPGDPTPGNWVSLDDTNTAHARVDEAGVIKLRHCRLIRFSR